MVQKYTTRTTLNSTVAQLKTISEEASRVPPQHQKLIYRGHILENDHTLRSYGLQADHTVHMVLGFAQTQQPPPPAHPTSFGVGSNDDGSLTDNLAPESGFTLLGRGAGAAGRSGGTFTAASPEVELIQQQLTPNQNQNMMTEIMNMSAMPSLLNNPDLIRDLMMSNPQLRQIMDRNPELSHVLNNPSILRQMVDVSRNPELMSEMMRQNVRAISAIESTPAGFNLLGQMYENVQQPFLNGVQWTPMLPAIRDLILLQLSWGTRVRCKKGIHLVTPQPPVLKLPWDSVLQIPTSCLILGATLMETRQIPLQGQILLAMLPSFGLLAGNGLRGMPDSNQMNQLL